MSLVTIAAVLSALASNPSDLPPTTATAPTASPSTPAPSSFDPDAVFAKRRAKAKPIQIAARAQDQTDAPIARPSAFAPAKPERGRPWAVGASVGTDGIGVDLKYHLTRTVVLRARAAGLSLRHGLTSDGVRYSGQARFGTVGGYLDWHPFGNGLFVSAGVLGGERRLKLSGTASNSVTFNGNVYTPAQLGTVTGKADLSSTAGFAGLGYDSTFGNSGPIGVNVLAGVQVGDAPKVSLTSNGLLASTPALQNDLRKEEDKIRKDLNFGRFYPVLSVGLNYRF